MMTAPAPATPPSPVFRDVPYVLDRLAWMRERRIWPDGARYLWTDAFAEVLSSQAELWA
ncbi:MAG TPA: hypothetical protein VJG13_16905 [Thermoanaerobaculia bacterium]|nr:hypothetical protein [Thermoanaerobaculia bacterium]